MPKIPDKGISHSFPSKDFLSRNLPHHSKKAIVRIIHGGAFFRCQIESNTAISINHIINKTWQSKH